MYEILYVCKVKYTNIIEMFQNKTHFQFSDDLYLNGFRAFRKLISISPEYIIMMACAPPWPFHLTQYIITIHIILMKTNY